MPVTIGDIPRLIGAGLRREFFKAYDAITDDEWTQVATVVPSDGDKETYGWLGDIPKMREFVDERVIHGLKEFGYEIANKTWESSIGVRREALEDDKYGQIKTRIRGLATEVARHKNELVFGLLGYGLANGICFDSLSFFNNSHVVGGGTQANLGSSALSIDAVMATIEIMMQFKNDKGKYLGIKPNVLVAPPSLYDEAMEVCGNTHRMGSTDDRTDIRINPLKGKLIPIITPYCNINPFTGEAIASAANSWYLLDTTKFIKPLIFQERVPVEFQALEAESESGFMRDQYVYGIRARYNAGYGLWQCAYAHKVA